jgi:hypothetical protein
MHCLISSKYSSKSSSLRNFLSHKSCKSFFFYITNVFWFHIFEGTRFFIWVVIWGVCVLLLLVCVIFNCPQNNKALLWLILYYLHSCFLKNCLVLKNQYQTFFVVTIEQFQWMSCSWSGD